MTHPAPPICFKRKFLSVSCSFSDRGRQSRMTNPKISLNPRLSHQLLLALVLTMTCHSSVTGATNQFRGEVGGSVTFRCLAAGHKKLNFWYIQRDQEFVNGYYASRNTSHLGWRNTRVDHNKATMDMYNLNISHNGDYQCHYRYHDSQTAEPTITLHLSVTSNYSKPALTVDHCGDGMCKVTCSSHGGYPATEVMWNVPGSQKLKVENISEMTDPVTMTVSSSSTVSLNCSNGEVSVSCSLDDLTSNIVPVCTPMDPPTHSPYVISAAVVVVVVVMVTGFLWWKCKKGQRGAAEAHMSQGNGCEEEVTVLNENKEGKDAS